MQSQASTDGAATHGGGTPDDTTYKSVITTCLAANRLQEATGVLRDMLAAGGGGRVPSVVYTALMQEHLASGEWARALDVFTTMTAGAKTLTVHTYNLYLAALQAGYVHTLFLFHHLPPPYALSRLVSSTVADLGGDRETCADSRAACTGARSPKRT